MSESDSMKQVAMIDILVDLGLQMCGKCPVELFNLTIASPGVVVALYVMAVDAIDRADITVELKAATRRDIRSKTTRLLKMVMDVVASDDPARALAAQHDTLKQALAMGPAEGDVH